MSEILNFQAGREAFIAGKPRDSRRNEHWLRGWDQEHEDAIAWEKINEREKVEKALRDAIDNISFSFGRLAFHDGKPLNIHNGEAWVRGWHQGCADAVERAKESETKDVFDEQ